MEDSPLAPATENLLCDYCQSSNKKNHLGQPEDLLICKDCSNKGEVVIFALGIKMLMLELFPPTKIPLTITAIFQALNIFW